MHMRSDAVTKPLSKKTVHTSIILALAGGLLIALAGELAAAPVLKLLQVPDDVFPLALLYLRIYLLGMPVILLYNFEAAIFRSIGETKTPLLALAFSGCLNVVLNLFFVIVLHMTVNGVAIATVISNCVSSLILFWKLRHSKLEIHVSVKDLKIDPESMGRILKIGLPAGIQSAVFSLSNIVIQSSINSLGTIVMAASSAAYNLEIITYDILNSFSQACTTFVGQNFGAGNMKRCSKTLALCIVEGLVVLAAAIMLILFFGHSLLALFNSDPQVVSTGYIRLMAIVRAHVFSPAIRGNVRLSEGVGDIHGSRNSDNYRRMRYTFYVGSICLPTGSHIPDDHERVSCQPFHDRIYGFLRPAVLHA